MISSFADYALENDLGGHYYTDPDLTCREHPGKVEEYELDRLRNMMIDMLKKPEDFNQWFGRFATTPRHELDVAPEETEYTTDEVLEALQSGATLFRLNGLRMLRIGNSFFVNSQRLDTVDAETMDQLCRYTEVDAEMLGSAIENPAFVAELAALINQGYWFFDAE